jgi:isopentenyldiphosphate isomerase
MENAPEEMVDVLDPSGIPSGRVVPKGEAHGRGLLHGCAHVWIASPGGPGRAPHLLVQRRADTKETWPGRLDVTAAGHLGAGEGPVRGALRELEEELGLRVLPGDLIPLGIRRVELRIPAGADREVQHVFLLLRELDPEGLRLQEEEVAAVLSLPLGDVEALVDGETVEFEDGEGVARMEDFVPGEGGYLRRVSRAAREVLAGREPGPVF